MPSWRAASETVRPRARRKPTIRVCSMCHYVSDSIAAGQAFVTPERKFRLPGL
jgi:hypothetical protein